MHFKNCNSQNGAPFFSKGQGNIKEKVGLLYFEPIFLSLSEISINTVKGECRFLILFDSTSEYFQGSYAVPYDTRLLIKPFEKNVKKSS
jgi:hypothetical protein